jgi:7-keto-8-aminopelargonate synthetase-like enzyme
MDAYNRVQAVERAVGRVQNYVADLADAGAKLAGLPRPPMESGGSQAQQAFEALRDAGVIGRGLCRQLVRAQTARTRIEHSYVQTPAGDIHRAATLVRDAAPDFVGSYRTWIEPLIADPDG